MQCHAGDAKRSRHLTLHNVKRYRERLSGVLLSELSLSAPFASFTKNVAKFAQN